jgi:hypothetical protein
MHPWTTRRLGGTDMEIRSGAAQVTA